jgi:F-box interacting protein
MDCPKRGCAVAGLPDDPLVEILSRVPFKSICRFKCVSKTWRDLIADPLHRRKLPQTLEGFHCLDHVFIDLMGRSAPPVDPSFSFLREEPPGMKHIRILHSCNGLLLLKHGARWYADRLGYVVCNPTTEEWVAVPSCGWWEESVGENAHLISDPEVFLIFDPTVSSHFRLLEFIQSIRSPYELVLRTYSSETGLWTNRSDERRRLVEAHESLQSSSIWFVSSPSGSAFVNGMLHYVIDHYQKRQRLIVAADWEGKTRRVMSLPLNHGSQVEFVGQSQGRLYCIMEEEIEDKPARITIWVLEDYDKEEWVMKHHVSLLQLFGKLLVDFYYTVVAIHPDRDLIFINHQDQQLISYNMDSKEVTVLSTLRDEYDCITPYVPYFSESSVLSNKL